MRTVIDFVAPTDFGNSFELDANNKIQPKVDNSTIERKVNGALGLKTSSQEFIEAVKANESITVLSTRIEDGKRYISYQNEMGDVSEIDMTSFIVDIHTNGMVLDGQVLVTTDTNGIERRVDLSNFTTEDEVRAIIREMATVVLRTLGGEEVLRGFPIDSP